MPHPAASHADHDPLAIAAFAAGDATGPELDEALALVAACPDCAGLHHDLRAIAAALPALPAPARSRDFRLTPEQAGSLRPAGWRRLLAPLAGPRFAFAGPLGTGLATLGIAGLLVAGSVGIPLGGAALAPAADDGSPNAAMLPAAEPVSPEAAPLLIPGDRGTNVAAPGPSADPNDAQLSGAAGATEVPGDERSLQATGTPVPEPEGVSPVAGLAAVLLLAGIVLVGLRAVARRAA